MPTYAYTVQYFFRNLDSAERAAWFISIHSVDSLGLRALKKIQARKTCCIFDLQLAICARDFISDLWITKQKVSLVFSSIFDKSKTIAAEPEILILTFNSLSFRGYYIVLLQPEPRAEAEMISKEQEADQKML